jgi:hypothetical protein
MATAQRLPTGRPAEHKTRLTVSLEPRTVRFLKQRKNEVKAPTMSACVENIIAECREKVEMDGINAQMLAFYDGMTEQERAENKSWGSMSERELIGSAR